MRMLKFTFRNEARWIMIFTFGPIILGIIGFLIARLVHAIR